MKLTLLLAAYLSAEQTVGDLLANATPLVLARGAASADLQRRLPIAGQREYVELIESNNALSGDAYHMGCLGGSVLRRAVPKVGDTKSTKLSGRAFWFVVGLDSQGIPKQAISLTREGSKAVAKFIENAAMQSTYAPCEYDPGDSFSGPIVVLYEFGQDGNLLPSRKMIDLGIQQNLEMVLDSKGKTVSTIKRLLYP